MPPCFLSEIPTLDPAPRRCTPTCLTPVRIQTKSGECPAPCAPASHWSHRGLPLHLRRIFSISSDKTMEDFIVSFHLQEQELLGQERLDAGWIHQDGGDLLLLPENASKPPHWGQMSLGKHPEQVSQAPRTEGWKGGCVQTAHASLPFQIDVRHESVFSWHRAHGGCQVLLLVCTEAFIPLMKSWKSLKTSYK